MTNLLRISRTLLACLFFIFGNLLIGNYCFAEISVIVHPSNTNSINKDAVNKIFLGKAKSFPNGSGVIPINLSEGLATRDQFNEIVLEKSASQVKAYWSKLLFTGKGTPPKEEASEADVLKLVADNPSTIGYIDSSLVDGSVKVVFTF